MCTEGTAYWGAIRPTVPQGLLVLCLVLHSAEFYVVWEQHKEEMVCRAEKEKQHKTVTLALFKNDSSFSIQLFWHGYKKNWLKNVWVESSFAQLLLIAACKLPKSVLVRNILYLQKLVF